jgi:hypothetical protein
VFSRKGRRFASQWGRVRQLVEQPARVSVIAYFKTNSHGVAIQSSVDIGRLAEEGGVEIVLSTATVPNPPLGRLDPC